MVVLASLERYDTEAFQNALVFKEDRAKGFQPLEKRFEIAVFAVFAFFQSDRAEEALLYGVITPYARRISLRVTEGEKKAVPYVVITQYSLFCPDIRHSHA